VASVNNCGVLHSVETPPVAVYPIKCENLDFSKLEALNALYGGFVGVDRILGYETTTRDYQLLANEMYNVVVQEALNTANIYKSDRSKHFAYIIGEVNADFLQIGHITANRYIIHPKLLSHFLLLPGFVLEAVRLGYVKCGEYLGNPVLFSTQVPGNEIICTYVNSMSPFGFPILFATDRPIGVTDDGILKLECGVKTVIPELIRKIVLA